jgi:hypothetical protein
VVGAAKTDTDLNEVTAMVMMMVAQIKEEKRKLGGCPLNE